VANENNVIAGSESGGMWRSTDGGVSWTRTIPLIGFPGASAVVQDKRPGHQNVWYNMTGEAFWNAAGGGSTAYFSNGMNKSTDSGATWTSLSATASGTPHAFDSPWDVCWNVAADAGNLAQDVVYAAAYNAIYRSINGGAAWTLVRGTAFTSPYSEYTNVAVTTTSVVYAFLSTGGSQKGIWRSPGGTAYTNITPANFPATYERMAIGINPNNENIVYFFGSTPGSGRMSTDFQGDTLWNSLWRYEYLSGTGAGAAAYGRICRPTCREHRRL
jgi:photosystem II stability/assembly factor-like uncharacterized protein